MNKQEIQQKIANNIIAFINIAEQVDEYSFFQNINNKWSIAENGVHLILSVKPINLVLSLPRFLLKIFGKSNKPNMNYSEVVKKYTDVLQIGAVAKSEYVPKKSTMSKSMVLQKLKSHYETLCF